MPAVLHCRSPPTSIMRRPIADAPAKRPYHRRKVGPRREPVRRDPRPEPPRVPATFVLNRSTVDVEFTPDELEFIKAMDRYKRDNRRPFPAWHEVLSVVRSPQM